MDLRFWLNYMIDRIDYIIYSHKTTRFDGLDHDFSFRHGKFRVFLNQSFVSHSFVRTMCREEIRVKKRYLGSIEDIHLFLERL